LEKKHTLLKWTVGLALIFIISLFIEFERRTGSLSANTPTWLIVRVLGISAYLLLFCGICLGIMAGMPIWGGKKNGRDLLLRIHFYFNTIGVFVAMLHPLLLVVDPYVPFSWMQLLIPFTAPREPFLYGLGTLTMYGLLFVLITTDLKKKMPVKLWKSFHLIAYVLYLLALTHGIMGGTDSSNIIIFSMYVITFVSMLALMIIQIQMVSALKKKALSKQHLAERNMHQ
jgi:predicted ferric reductase